MAANPQPMHVDVHVHILPLLELCHYAAMASTAMSGLANLAGLRPDLARELHAAAPDFSELADSDGGTLAARGISIAIDLLRYYDEMPCAPTPCALADKGGSE